MSGQRAVDSGSNCWKPGEADGIQAAGLGARDTLRLEAAMPLYGHELSERITPIQAGLEFAVRSCQRVPFPGADAFAGTPTDEQLPARGLGLNCRQRAAGKAIAYWSCRAGRGRGDQRHLLAHVRVSLAMAYVRPDCSQPGQRAAVDVRGQPEPATVVDLPFYRSKA